MRRQISPEEREALDKNPHTRRKRKPEGKPWTHDGKSRLQDERRNLRTTGHIAGGTMIGGS